MAIDDGCGRGWIRDSETGELVELGTRRALAVRAGEYEKMAAELGQRVATEQVTKMSDGVVLRALKEVAAMFRRAESKRR